MDDILVFSKTYEYHVEHIEWVLHALKDAGFKVALEKSAFFLSEISFLGYIVTVEGLKPGPRKVAAVQEVPAPVTLTQVRAFLGLASYYRRFIKGFAGVAKPLTNLLKKEEQLIWTPECEAAFQVLKETLTSALVLARPDPTRPFALHTDWQPHAISVVLTQHGADGREHVIEYEDAWELHRALYKSVALGMFRIFVDYEDHCIGEHFLVYYIITQPKPAQKEGTVALYPFAQFQTTDPGLLELIHLELLSIAQVIASEEEEIQPRLRTAAAPRRTYNAVIRSAPPKAPKKTPKRKRRHPSPGAARSWFSPCTRGIPTLCLRVRRRWLRRLSCHRRPSRACPISILMEPGHQPQQPEEEAEWDYRIPYPDPPSSRDPSASASHPGVPRSLTLAVPPSRTVHPREVDFMVEPTTIRLEAIAGSSRPDPAWEPYLTPPFQGCIAARLAGTLIYETGQRPNVMYHFLVFAAQKRERRPYTETHLVMTGPGPRLVRKRVVQAVADLAPRVLSHVPGAYLYPSFVQHHFREEDAPTTPATMAAFLPPIPPPLNPYIDHFL
ncbi:hypothetical protein CBR_g37403 [Chara braunii]|uniref:Reverse transcriptase domain-containing protein n=1 Tax=Chara braunii TaxID=69332 RepID=A0A388LMQ5_CHABU|nr:hypothetical protein CBR_g37403 [Chara braunii]|eukprot:GBG83598.1 hypothetical protein CBR_g37403 [Chara braunii]